MIEIRQGSVVQRLTIQRVTTTFAGCWQGPPSLQSGFWYMEALIWNDSMVNSALLKPAEKGTETAIVRALGCFLSLCVVFLGFIWIAFDPNRQAWHDKIAGTVVVRAKRGAPLV